MADSDQTRETEESVAGEAAGAEDTTAAAPAEAEDTTTAEAAPAGGDAPAEKPAVEEEPAAAETATTEEPAAEGEEPAAAEAPAEPPAEEAPAGEPAAEAEPPAPEEAAPEKAAGPSEEHTYESLKGKTVAQLREIAEGFGDNDELHGYTTMHKEELLVALCKALGIEAHEHHEVVGIDKLAVKAKIRALKAEREALVEAGDSKQLKIVRRRIRGLKRKIRKATV